MKPDCHEQRRDIPRITGFEPALRIEPTTGSGGAQLATTVRKRDLVGSDELEIHPYFLIAVCFAFLTGFRLPGGPQASGGNYQFYKEKESSGVWIFEPDTGTSKFFDVENGVVIINSFQMDSITVKSDVKSIRGKTP